MEDDFRQFILRDRGLLGWECTVKPGVTPQVALSAVTKISQSLIAKFALDFICPDDDGSQLIWFRKAQSVLRFVINGKVAKALSTARTAAAASANEVVDVSLCGITATSFHEWVQFASDQIAQTGDWLCVPVEWEFDALYEKFDGSLRMESQLACENLSGSLNPELPSPRPNLNVQHAIKVSGSLETTIHGIAVCCELARESLEPWEFIPHAVFGWVFQIANDQELMHEEAIVAFSDAFILGHGHAQPPLRMGHVVSASAHHHAAKIRQFFLDQISQKWYWFSREYLFGTQAFRSAISAHIYQEISPLEVYDALKSFPDFDSALLIVQLQQERAFFARLPEVNNDMRNSQSHSDQVAPTEPSKTAGEAKQWPEGDGWEFREGEAAYRRCRFLITGDPARVLKKLAESFDRPVNKEALLTLMSQDSTASPITWLRDTLFAARKAIRERFKLDESVDPIPNVQRGSAGAWKLDMLVFLKTDEESTLAQ